MWAQFRAQLTSLASAVPQAVVATKRGMNPGAQAKANKVAQAAKGQTLKGMTNKCVAVHPPSSLTRHSAECGLMCSFSVIRGLQVKGGGRRKGGPPQQKPGNNKAPLAFAKGTLQVSINNTGAIKVSEMTQMAEQLGPLCAVP